MKTGVQSVLKALKTLDSGFRRNDVKKNQIDFFTPSPIEGISANLAGQRLFFARHSGESRNPVKELYDTNPVSKLVSNPLISSLA